MTSIHARQTETSAGQMEPPSDGRTGNNIPISAETVGQLAVALDASAEGGLPPGLNFMIRDEPGYRIALSVEDLGNEDAMEMVLQTEQHITWWKSLSYFPAVQGGRGLGPEIRIETRDRVHEARQLLVLPSLTDSGILELWKGGFVGFGAFAGSLPINAYANRGRRFTFRWVED